MASSLIHPIGGYGRSVLLGNEWQNLATFPDWCSGQASLIDFWSIDFKLWSVNKFLFSITMAITKMIMTTATMKMVVVVVVKIDIETPATVVETTMTVTMMLWRI